LPTSDLADEILQIVVETGDALRDYHAALSSNESTDEHTILILDKKLHAFPWESLPSLRNQSISRLPSLANLQQRILDMRCAESHTSDSSSSSEDDVQGHFISRSSGASILNPSGDLTNTQATMQPILHTLPSSWLHTTVPAPSEAQMSNILSSHELMLYFGHGSGAQYIRSRGVKKLTNAPTTWLMGCSSAAITEHGEFEPSGMVLAYLSAGSPAVVGTLWDVTDKDCDKASVKAGEVWGLWDAPGKEEIQKGKGKQREVEKVRGGRVAERRKFFETSSGEETCGHLKKEKNESSECKPKASLTQAIAGCRDACYLKYLNGAALVVYGIPVYLKE
jgi:separase